MDRQDVLDLLTDDSVHAIAEIVMRETGQGMSARDLDRLNDAVWPALEMILPSTIEMRPDTTAKVTTDGPGKMYEALKTLQLWSWAQPWPVREADVWHQVDAAIAHFESENAPAARVTLAGTEQL